MTKRQSESEWISLSDMMTGLMLVFLLIAVLVINQLHKDLQDYQDTRTELYEELTSKFEDKYQQWEMEIDKDLTIRFKNDDILFEEYSSVIKSDFKTILDEFVPEYLSIISADKYEHAISEVRIEGHTAYDSDYIYTVELSQDRARNVLAYVLSNSYYKGLPEHKRKDVEFWLTANGLGKGRTLDASGQYVVESGADIHGRSRRVEFRIVTKSDELIEEVIKRNQ